MRKSLLAALGLLFLRKSLLAALGLFFCTGAFSDSNATVTYTQSQLNEMAMTGEFPNAEVDTDDVSQYTSFEACVSHLEAFIQDAPAVHQVSDAPPNNMARTGYYTDKLKKTSCAHVAASGGKAEKWLLFRTSYTYHLPKWGDEDSEDEYEAYDPNADQDDPNAQQDDGVPPHCQHDPNQPDCPQGGQNDPYLQTHAQHCQQNPTAPDCPHGDQTQQQSDGLPPHCQDYPNDPACQQGGGQGNQQVHLGGEQVDGNNGQGQQGAQQVGQVSSEDGPQQGQGAQAGSDPPPDCAINPDGIGC